MGGRAATRCIGEKFGYLTITDVFRKEINGRFRTVFKVRCDCGNMKEVMSHNITQGRTKSCGCKSGELKAQWKHGLWRSRIYQTYHDMLQRCYNPNNARYHRYGGRGIVVCDDWRSSIESFNEWAMCNGYSDDLTIERIENDGDYSPSNCKWATMEEQLQNRDTSRMGNRRKIS